MPFVRCPVRPPAPAPTIAAPRTAGGVLGRLLGLRHPDLAVVFLSDHRGVEGPDRSRGVEVEHGLVVSLGVIDLVVDGGVQKYRSICHFWLPFSCS
jgi:hypothetical protein